MRQVLGRSVAYLRSRMDRQLLHIAIKAGVAISILSLASHHLGQKRSFDRSGLERLASGGGKPAR
jgi:hypothetical protein